MNQNQEEESLMGVTATTKEATSSVKQRI